MPRYKDVDGVRIQFTAEEEIARDAEEKAWNDSDYDRAIADLRFKRNRLLSETDWMANSDVTMSDEVNAKEFPTKPGE
jgi:hypothetical protein